MTTLKLVFIISILIAAACTQATNSVNQTATNTTAVNTANVNSGTTNSSAALPTPVDDLAAGREIYSQNCVACHKENGKGGKVTIEGKTLDPDDLTAASKIKATDERMYAWIADGIPDEGMPPFKDKLSDAQIRQVITFIRKGIQNK